METGVRESDYASGSPSDRLADWKPLIGGQPMPNANGEPGDNQAGEPNAGSDELAHLKARIERLETQLAQLEDRDAMERQVTERVINTLTQVKTPALPAKSAETASQSRESAPIHTPADRADPFDFTSPPPVYREPEVAKSKPAPSVNTGTAAGQALAVFTQAAPNQGANWKYWWSKIPILTELGLMVRMYFDPRYRLSRFAQFGVPTLLGLMLMNYFTFSFFFNFPLLGAFFERGVLVVLAVLLYKVLAREVGRYELVLDYIRRYSPR